MLTDIKPVPQAFTVYMDGESVPVTYALIEEMERVYYMHASEISKADIRSVGIDPEETVDEEKLADVPFSYCMCSVCMVFQACVAHKTSYHEARGQLRSRATPTIDPQQLFAAMSAVVGASQALRPDGHAAQHRRPSLLDRFRRPSR